jgi:hypothetical protein
VLACGRSSPAEQNFGYSMQNHADMLKVGRIFSGAVAAVLH